MHSIIGNMRAKNIIRIHAGLGNQLFEYAFGYALYKKTDREFKLDIDYFNSFRPYQLKAFNIDVKTTWISVFSFIWNKVLMKMKLTDDYELCRKNKLKRSGLDVVSEKKETYYDESIFHSEPAYYTGYWQSWRYFDEFYERLKLKF